MINPSGRGKLGRVSCAPQITEVSNAAADILRHERALIGVDALRMIPDFGAPWSRFVAWCRNPPRFPT